MSKVCATVPEGERDEEGRLVYDAQAVRQGRIVLNTPRRRMIFIGGLAALVLSPLVVAFLV